jgi:8-oxo-dGTP pyrophosphatase MutT (NUDIX family)
MPDIVADSVDAFVFRKSGARVQFLLLQRETGRSFAGVWQSMHTRIESRETTLAAARRAIRESIGVDPLSAYSIDYIGQIFDHERDLIVLAPSIAFSLPPGAEYTLGDGYKALAWFDAEDATNRLLWADQREAIRRFAALVADGGDDLELYRIG